MYVPDAGEDVVGRYGEHGKGNLVRRVISRNANGPSCAAVVESARAINLVCLPRSSIWFCGINGYGKEAIGGIAGRRVSVGDEVADGLNSVPIVVKREGEVLGTLPGHSEVERYAASFASRRAA